MIHKKIIYTIKILCISILPSHFIEAVEIIHIPIVKTNPNKNININIEASVNNIEDFLWAKLFYKNKTDSIFTSIPMFGSGRYFYSTIPGNVIINEDILYYIEVTTQTNTIEKIPKNENEYFTIKIDKDITTNNSTQIKIIEPNENSQINNNNFKIIGSILNIHLLSEEGIIKATLDDYDINIKRIGTFLKWKPDKKLNIGKHNLNIKLTTSNKTIIDEKNINFEIINDGINENKNLNEETGWKDNGSISLEYQFAKTISDTTNPILYPNGFYIAQTEWKTQKDNNAIFLGPFLYSSQISEYGNKTNKFSLGLQTSHLSIRGGSISSALSELVASNVAYWGAEIEIKTIAQNTTSNHIWNFTLKSFAGKTKFATESTNISPGIFAQQAYGATLQFKPLKEQLLLSIQFTNSEDIKKSITSLNTVPNINNKVFGALLLFNLTKPKIIKKIEFEWASSISQIKYNNQNENITAHGGSLAFSGESKILNSKWVLKNILFYPNFYTQFGNKQSDIYQTSISINEKIFKNNITLSQNITTGFDNIQKQKKYRTYIINTNASIDISFSKLPAVSFVNQNQYQLASNNFERINNNFTTTISKNISIDKNSISNVISFNQNNTFEILINKNNKTSARNYNIYFKPNIYCTNFLSLSSNISYSLNESYAINLKQNLSHSLIQSIEFIFYLFKRKLTTPIALELSEKIEKDSELNQYVLKYLSIICTSKIEMAITENQKLNIGLSLNITKNTHNIEYQNYSITTKYEATF